MEFDILNAIFGNTIYNGARDPKAHENLATSSDSNAMLNGFKDSRAHENLAQSSDSDEALFNGFKDEAAHQSNSTGPLQDVYYGEYNNALRYKPSINPARQQFSGIVNFYFNPAIAGLVTTADTRNGLSSLVKTATMPSFKLKTDIRNQYNKKRVTVSGVEYDPIKISVYDTVDSVWMTTIMRTYQHLFLNPANRFETNGTGETVPRPLPYDVVPEKFTSGSESGSVSGFTQKWNEESTGYNIRPGIEKNIISRIDFLMYHAQKFTRYTVFNPIIVGFDMDGIDYSSSQPIAINMDIEYENFSMDPLVNNFLPEDDMKRFTNFSEGSWKLLREGGQNLGDFPGYKPEADTNQMPSLKRQSLNFLSPQSAGSTETARTQQDQNFWNNFNPG